MRYNRKHIDFWCIIHPTQYYLKLMLNSKNRLFVGICFGRWPSIAAKFLCRTAFLGHKLKFDSCSISLINIQINIPITMASLFLFFSTFFSFIFKNPTCSDFRISAVGWRPIPASSMDTPRRIWVRPRASCYRWRPCQDHI